MPIVSFFTVFLYQPLLNVLVALYWALSLITDNPDMGVAVILMTLVVRVILLPLSLAGHRSEKERREISKKIVNLEKELSDDPIERKSQVKQVMKGNKGVLISESITLVIQTTIALMLWRLFATGLSGRDLHLLYDFMPQVELPFNLNFLGKFDLTHPHITLNVLQSGLIFVLETLSVYTSPYHHSRSEVVRLQLVLPLVSFLVFMGLPAGKKLFVITTLCFSIALTSIRAARRAWADLQERFNKRQEKKENTEEKIVEEVV
jgi:membrane protein insertase Oxa1/YidC/SpoIIIJ